MKHIRYYFVAVACLMSMVASAQWQWTDKNGNRVFSDRAPPPDVPEKNILKRPGSWGKAPGNIELPSSVEVSPSALATASAPRPAGSAPQLAGSAPRLSGVDKELADKKKKVEDEAAAKRKAEEEKTAQVKAENCERARQTKANYESGIRLARVNPKTGEQEVLDDAARAAELKRIDSVVEANCK